MASIRDRLIDALFAAMNGSALGAVPKPTGLLVTEERLHPNEQSQLPVIGLYFEDEEPEPLEKQRFKAPITQKALGVTLEYRALASMPAQAVQKPRKVIDPLYLWLSKESDAIVAAAAQRITIHYRTARLNPSTTS